MSSSNPCLACPADAAPGWLLCAHCAAAIDDAMLDELVTDYEQLPAWLAKAQDRLQAEPDPARRARGQAVWSRKLRVYERLALFLTMSLAMRAGYPETPVFEHLAVADGYEAWQRFLEAQEMKGARPFLGRVVAALRGHGVEA